MEQNVIRRIAAIAQVTKNDIVVEIGAGIGVLTEYLAQNAAKLIAVELDDKLVEVLKDKLSKYNNVQIYSGDILKFDFRAIARDGQQKIKVIGNVPYNISISGIVLFIIFPEDYRFLCLNAAKRSSSAAGSISRVVRLWSAFRDFTDVRCGRKSFRCSGSVVFIPVLK